MTANPRLKLRSLHEAAERTSANLVELELDSSRQLLDASELRGQSAARWSTAGAALTELWRRHGLLEALLERADKLQGSRHAEELRSLLDGRSIELASADVPLAQRSLLSGPQAIERCSPDELLETMSSAFDEVKQVVSTIGYAWDSLIPKLDGARRAVQECRRLAEELGESDRAELGPAEHELARLTDSVTHDPLSVAADEVDALTQSLQALQTDLEGSLALKRGFEARMLDARELLERVRSALEQAESARQEVLAKITAPAPAPALRGADDCARGLAEITALAESGAWREARQALDAWTAQAQTLITDAERAREGNRAPIEQRNQFRALLEAYQVKAKRLGRLEDPEVAAVFERAHAALYTAPTDLARAAQLVRSYQQALNGVRGTRHEL
ncbi:MAG TPA: hypothetical protein VMU39_29355 [Solirubrobacteraceae bacterium]|nr:hypothetical protein [Solirubrobacteraceae bacterium]